MNHFSRLNINTKTERRARGPASSYLVLLTALLGACGGPVSESAAQGNDLEYSVHYVVEALPAEQAAEVTLKVSQRRRLLREMRFDISDAAEVSGQGTIERSGGKLRWLVPETGGKLQWRINVANRRGDNGYDALIGPDWGLFRAEDVIPRAATRTLKSAKGNSRLSIKLPVGWSAVTEYAEANGSFSVDSPDRRFSQPTGWIVIGSLGVRREHIAGVRVAIAAPENQQARRLDMLALLSWTLPELARVLPEMPARLTVVTAGEPMWRGGLSAPQSIYIHSDCPMISENATSTLLHEVLHVALDIRATRGYDWIVEGFAELYSLELLRRSGTISADRYESALVQQAKWSKSATKLCRAASTGATTALAVVKLHQLDEELLRATGGKANLDDILQELAGARTPVDLAALQSAFERLALQKSDTLHTGNLPGCRTLASATSPS